MKTEASTHYSLSVFEYALHAHKREVLKNNGWNG